jgi:hypothetical protein
MGQTLIIAKHTVHQRVLMQWENEIFGTLVDRSRKASTLKNYNSSLRQYTNFCRQ